MDRIRAYKNGMGLHAERDDNDWLAKVAESDQKTAELKDTAQSKKNDGVPEKAGNGTDAFVKVSTPPSKYERLAKFLALIGEEEAAKVLSGFPKAQAVILQKEAEALRNLKSEGRTYGMTAEEARAIYEEFRTVFSGKTEIATQQPFAFLQNFQPEQIALLLHKEAAQTCALVIARLPPKIAAATLGFVESEKKRQIAFRIARLKPVSPEVICVIADTLRERARSLGSDSGTAIDGIGTLAEILKNTDVTFGDKIISSLAEQDPLLSLSLKERLYTLDDVCRTEDKPIAEKLADMSEKDIALLVRGRPDNFVEKILSNVSAGRRSLIHEESDIMGAVLRSDTEAALKVFLQWFRDKREKGEVLFLDDELVV
jgi:flagellar motor switch protein FliG